MRKTLKYSIIGIGCLYLLTDFYIYRCYDDESTVRTITWATRIYSEIPDDSIPDNIINAYDKVFPGSLTNTVYPDLLWCIISPRHNNAYVQINLAYDLTTTSGFKLISVANQLHNRLTNRQCIYAYLSRFDFLNNRKGIRMAAMAFYNKAPEALSERECLELVVMTQNPAMYNKTKHQNLLDKEVGKYL